MPADALTTRTSGRARIPGVEVLLGRFRTVLFDVTGVIQLGPMVVLFAAHPDERTTAAWAMTIVVLIVWSASRFLVSMRRRFIGMTLAGLLLLVTPLVIAPSGAPPFVLASTVAFSVVISAIVAYRARWALAIIVIATGLLGLIGTTDAPAAARPLGTLDTQLGMLLCLVAGTGLLVTRIQFAKLWRQGDRLSRQAARLASQRRRQHERRQAQAAAERRIHETVLNTLTAVSMGVGEDRPEEIQEACRTTLAALDLVPRRLSEPTVSEAVRAAQETAAGLGLSCVVVGECDLTLDDATALVVRDAAMEALTNVQRHSGVAIARIEIARSTESTATVTIIDAGCGFSRSSRERFGIRLGIRAALREVGGSATVDSRPGHGTRIGLTIPGPDAATGGSEARPRTLDIGASLTGRLGLLGSTAVFAAFALPLSQAVFGSLWLAATVVLTLAVGAALAVLWNSRLRSALAIAALGTTALVYLLSAPGASSCTASPGIAWIIALAGGGGLVLPLLAPASQVWRALVIVSATIAGAVLVAEIPRECALEGGYPIMTNVAYLTSIWLVMLWGERSFLLNRAKADVARKQVLEDRLEAARASVVRESWAAVDDEARELLQAIASGMTSSATESVQRGAAALSDSIRRRLRSPDDEHVPRDQASARSTDPAGSPVLALIEGQADSQGSRPA